MTIHMEVTRGIRGWLQAAFDDAPVEIDHHHLLRTQVLVTNAARLDQHESTLWIAYANVSAGPHHKVVFRQFKMQLNEFFLEFLEHLTSWLAERTCST